LQTSVVHVVPSAQAESSGVALQPVAGLQPSTVQSMPSLQTIGGCVQTPAWQTSCVQTFPPGSSEHAVPVSGG
jgi:hypothetical protein